MKLINAIIGFIKMILPDLNPYIPKRKCKHSMKIEQYREIDHMLLSSKKHSREICEKCGWVDYDSYWTWHENPEKDIS